MIMGYWDDPNRPLESYSNAEEDRLSNGRTPRQEARIQRAFKVLLEARQRQDEEKHKEEEASENQSE